MRRSLLILLTTAALSGCALSITDQTPASLARTPTGVYPIEARTTASGYTVTGVTATVQGDPYAMTDAGGGLWRVSVPLSPCRTTFTLAYEARGSGTWASTTRLEPVGGTLVKSITGTAPAACPATFGLQLTVNTTTDAPDANPGNRICATAAGQCSLRAAIMEANTFAGVDVITVPAGTYTLTLTGQDDTAALGDLDLTDTVAILGTNAVVFADPMLNDRVFDIHQRSGPVGVSATLSGLTVQNGIADVGGGIRTTANLIFENGVIDNNTGRTAAGGIFNNGGAVVVRDSTVRNNRSDLATGGGLRQDAGQLVIERTLFETNESNQHGGAISLVAGDMTVTNSTLHGNRADTYGGAIHANGAANVTLRNVTMTGNVADADGSGFGGGGGIRRSGTATQFVIVNSIIAQNTTRGIPDDCDGTTFYSFDFNLIGTGTGCTIEGAVAQSQIGTNVAPINPRLEALASYGGPTKTRRPEVISPAIDTGSDLAPVAAGPIACPAEDQRGTTRPRDGNSDGTARCDMGAVER